MYRETRPYAINRGFQVLEDWAHQVSLEEINKLGQNWITGKNIVALITVKEKEGIKVPTEQKVAQIIQSVQSKKLEPYVENISDAPILSENPTPAPVIKRTENTEVYYTELSFGNGYMWY
jgi:zinc protease